MYWLSIPVTTDDERDAVFDALDHLASMGIEIPVDEDGERVRLDFTEVEDANLKEMNTGDGYGIVFCMHCTDESELEATHEAEQCLWKAGVSFDTGLLGAPHMDGTYRVWQLDLLDGAEVGVLQ